MAGLGMAPLGTAPYGLGTPATAPVPGGSAHNDGTGKQTGSRRISEETRQYVFDEYGRIQGMGDTRQRVLLALSTALGSSAQRDLGHDLASIEEIGEDFERRVDGELRSALARLVSERAVEIVSVSVERRATGNSANHNAGFIRLVWRDLSDPEKPEYTESVQ